MSGTKHNVRLDGRAVFRKLRADGWRLVSTPSQHVKC